MDLDKIRKESEEYQREHPIDREKSFYLRIEDEYHRLLIDYNGIDKMEIIILPVKIKPLHIYVPEEEIEEIINAVTPLKKETEKFGIKPDNSFYNRYYKLSRKEISEEYPVDIGKEMFGEHLYLCSDDTCLELIANLENFILTKYPEFKVTYENAKNIVDAEKERAALEEQEWFDSLSINTLKENYPLLFDENGEFTKEAIKTIGNLIDEHAPNYVNRKKKKNKTPLNKK